MRAGLVTELRALRRGSGAYELQVADLPWLVDTLGHGVTERAGQALLRLREDHLVDPESPVGAFFWLADQGTAGAPARSLEQRLSAYGETFACDPRTGLRRSDTGIELLAGMARDHSETDRPVGMFSLFQDGPNGTAVVDLWMTKQSFREPEVLLNGEPWGRPEFVVHSHGYDWGGRLRHRMIIDDVPLDLDVEPYEACLTVRVTWAMPIWPVWQITGWIADNRFAVRLQTFRERAAEASIVLRHELQPPS